MKIEASRLQRQIERCAQAGMVRMSLTHLDSALEEIGYKRRGHPATGIFQDMASREKYPGVTYSVMEADTGVSAFHVDARRDAGFQALQDLRRNTYAVVRGRLATL